MPYKFNDVPRDKFTKAKYQIKNCSEHNESLGRRGGVTIWISDDAVQNWTSTRRKTRGGQARFSDLAIEICLTLRVVFRLPLRQAPGFVPSIVRLMGLDFVAPNFSTLLRRGKGWMNWEKEVAGVPGFEPGMPLPKSGALPLGHTPTLCGSILTREWQIANVFQSYKVLVEKLTKKINWYL